MAIDLLSRFKSAKQQREIIENIGEGKIDLLIGTHRLLSKDIKFKDLGLLIVDEEQKFGVMHKEKLKLLKETVDTLTLSATPIPRTMHMSLIGAKDLSIINTPPHNRLPVKTEVSRFDCDLIREAVLKEIDRGGQVFFVHNRVQSIHGMAATLYDIVPEVSIAVAHGQMKGHELETVMHKFVRGEVQVLVSTMIIESGIDMPKANTLIVNRADKLGLSQLYQLRGRVGRSQQQAYAYLLIPQSKKPSRDAIKRLQTIQEYSHLGSGYKIAMRDLEIRGAGNIFGAEQTGFVNALGFELFTKIIRQSIRKVRKEMNIDSFDQAEESKDPFEARIKISINAYLPSDFVHSASERVDLYRRLVQTKSIKEIDQIHHEILDRFGPLPKPAQNLLDYIYLKRYAVKAGVEKLSVDNDAINGEFNNEVLPTGEQFQKWLADMVEHVPDSFQLDQAQNKLKFTMRGESGSSHIEIAKKFLQSIV
ncbi:MAG: TRCF domain-containing protein [candidate division KSB1 bacterium]|nr:TRCF domain-containing protein [candidate division KSB1 bacterium]